MKKRRFMVLASLSVSLAAFGVFGAGCAKDKTVDEYQREKLQENLALYESVAGSYTGVVTSKEDGREIGAIEIDLRAETVVNPSNDGNSALGTPTLVSNIRFLDENIVTFSTLKSFYDPRTGSYTAQISITRSSTGRAEAVSIAGLIKGNALTGEIGTIDYPKAGGRFVLVRGGKSITEIRQEKTPNEIENRRGSRQVSEYSGTTRFESGEKRPVHVVVLQPLWGTAEDILDLISPLKYVQVSFNYSQTLRILFNGALFDTRRGRLTGQTSLTVKGQVQQMSLECRTGEKGDLTCEHLTTGSGITATTRAKKNMKPGQAPKDPAEQQSVTRIYNGNGTMAGEPATMKLKVTLPARGRLDNLLRLFFPESDEMVNVAVTFRDMDTVSFNGIKWDKANGILDGSINGGGGADWFTAYIQCHGFYFTKTRRPFECTYWTSRSPEIQMIFGPSSR